MKEGRRFVQGHNRRIDQPLARPLEERFWSKVSVGPRDSCWVWQGALMGGYGYLVVTDKPRRTVKAHRLSWELAAGHPVPDGLFVLHHCDNPPCVNPAHLYVGTKAQNARDRAVRRRGKEQHQNGEANDNAKLTEAKVRAIFHAVHADGATQDAVAQYFGVSQVTVHRIVHRKTWRHLWE